MGVAVDDAGGEGEAVGLVGESGSGKSTVLRAVAGLIPYASGEITLAHGAVEQQNFPNYPVVRLADCPSIEVHIKESDAPLGGGGEPGTPPVAPAVTNAIFAATGIRIRELPISKHALKKGA